MKPLCVYVSWIMTYDSPLLPLRILGEYISFWDLPVSCLPSFFGTSVLQPPRIKREERERTELDNFQVLYQERIGYCTTTLSQVLPRAKFLFPNTHHTHTFSPPLPLPLTLPYSNPKFLKGGGISHLCLSTLSFGFLSFPSSSFVLLPPVHGRRCCLGVKGLRVQRWFW